MNEVVVPATIPADATAPQPHGADHRLTIEQLQDRLVTLKQLYAECFSVTLVKENGQGYNMVVHEGGATPKVRIALVITERPDIVGGTWHVRDAIERIFSGGQFPTAIEQVIDSTLSAAWGCVRLEIANGAVRRADFHYGELWP